MPNSAQAAAMRGASLGEIDDLLFGIDASPLATAGFP
jgi:hypothetical protein